MYSVSIAMATYNGEKFIEEQLRSIFQQTRQPDEVLICDDGSMDSTVNIVKTFIEKNNLKKKWKIITNEKNKGLTKNFLECAQMTKGNIVFFADQDDIWDENKILEMTNIIEKNEQIKVLSCTTTPVNENLNPIQTNIFYRTSALKTDVNIEKMTFRKQVKENKSSGLTLAFKREFLDYLAPIIKRYDLPFDLPFGYFAAAREEYFILKKPLVLHRVHSTNLSTPKHTLKSRLGSLSFHVHGRNIRIKLLEVGIVELKNKISSKDFNYLKRAFLSQSRSKKYVESRKFLPLVYELVLPNPMSNRKINILNLLFVLFGNYKNR